MSAAKQFVQWLAKNDPQILREAIARIKSKGGIEPFGFGQTEETEDDKAWYETVTDVVGNLATQYAKYKQQKQIIELNAERAKQGLPPVDPGDIAPQANVQIDVGWDTLKWPLMIGGGILALTFLRGK